MARRAVEEPDPAADGGEFEAPALEAAVFSVAVFVLDRDLWPGQPEKLGV